MKLTRKLLVALLALALIVCVIPAAFAAPLSGDGSAATPYVYEDGMLQMQGSFTTSATEATHVKFTAYEDGYLNFYDIAVDDWDCMYFRVTTSQGSFDVNTFDGNAVLIPGYITAGTEVSFTIETLKSDMSKMSTPVTFEFDVSGAIKEWPVQFVAPMFAPATVTVPAGKTIYLRVAAGNWSPMMAPGMNVSTANADDIADITVHMNGSDIVDGIDDDKIIEFSPASDSEDMMGAVILGFTNSGDADLTITITTVGTAQAECTHSNTTHDDGTPRTEHTDGILPHDVCNDCGALLIEGQMVTSVIDYADHYVDYIFATVTCTEPGDIAHYWCYNCSKAFSDEACTEELTSISSDALGHDMVPMDAEDPSCCGEGNIAYYSCLACGGYFADEKGELQYVNGWDGVKIPAKEDAHIWALVEKEGNVPADHAVTNLTYKCTCIMCWFANDMQDLTSVIATDPACGALTHNKEVAATAEKEGTKEHWSCAKCNKLFSDAAGKTEVKAADLVIAKLNDNPKTGDMGIALAAAVAVVSMGAVLVLTKKKEF